MSRLNTPSCSIASAGETSPPLSALCGSPLGSVSDAGADPSGRGTRDGGSVKPSAWGSVYPSLVPRPPSLFSQDPIHQRAQKHDDTDDPVRGEKGRIQF